MKNSLFKLFLFKFLTCFYIIIIINAKKEKKNDFNSQVIKEQSVQFSIWHSGKFRNGLLEHVGREWRKEEREGRKLDGPLCCKSAPDRLEQVNITVLEIRLWEVDAWKNVACRQGVFLH